MPEPSIYGSHLPELNRPMNTILAEIAAVRQYKGSIGVSWTNGVIAFTCLLP